MIPQQNSWPRSAGVLLHMTSLPGADEHGALGSAARHFIDWLATAGITVWQVLPLGPVARDGSPYYCLSSHAGNVRLIDVAALAEDGLFPIEARNAEPFAAWHARQLGRAARSVAREAGIERERFRAFRETQAEWLEDDALHGALQERLSSRSWHEWPTPLRDREPAALHSARTELAEIIERRCAEQYLFYRQWRALRAYAAARGIRVFGDLPIYVAPEAVDVWVNRALFELDASGRPTLVSGVPPDYFSADGQLWGNPLYRWPAHEASGFRWWLERLRAQHELYDLLRLDHFRALESYWAVPAGASTARSGLWQPAPGAALLQQVGEQLPSLRLVAEDLGVITPEVERLRDAFSLPGMRVLQFAFDGDADNPHLPHNWHANLVGYTGTHDNDTLVGWVAGLDRSTRATVREYVGAEHIAPALMRTLLASVAALAVLPMQDLLGLGTEARMNTPGTTLGNWHWRFDWSQVPPDLALRTRSACARYGRTTRDAAAR
jgi:4-alpha-glucanotransferase